MPNYTRMGREYGSVVHIGNTINSLSPCSVAVLEWGYIMAYKDSDLETATIGSTFPDDCTYPASPGKYYYDS